MNIRRIIREEMNDFDWVKDTTTIEVGKCFLINNEEKYKTRSLNAVVTIKEMEQMEWKNNIYQKGGKFNPNNIVIHLVGVTQKDKEKVGPNFRLSYSELIEFINTDYLRPTNCK